MNIKYRLTLNTPLFFYTWIHPGTINISEYEILVYVYVWIIKW